MDALTQKYKQVIEAQRQHLHSLQDKFNEKCDTIKAEAKQKLAGIDEQHREAREQVILWQKAELEKTLAWLKQEIHNSSRNTMKKLEEVQDEREAQTLEEIEAQLASL